MTNQLPGIHHITAIAGDPQANIDFYTGVLGLRLVKVTVNFDDPGTYHLYYGDGTGHPGTILTFFPWPSAPRGRRGTSQVGEIAFAVPHDSIGYWSARLAASEVAFRGPFERLGDEVISFFDSDGLGIELVASRTIATDRAYERGPIPLRHAIQGFHSATLWEKDYASTANLLTGTMGFNLVAQDGDRFRYRTAAAGAANVVDVIHAPTVRTGEVLVGSVHHIAWRTPDEMHQLEWRTELSRLQYDVTPVIDRKYFHSIYFREPGRILFEIATDPPGFTVDEPEEELGTHILLPPWLETDRVKVESALPKLRLAAPPAKGE